MEAHSSTGRTRSRQPVHSRIRLGIVSQDGDETFYMVKTNVPMEKLFLKFSDDKNLEYGTLRFLFDGKRIAPKSTPRKVGLKDLDLIEAMLDQIGGGCKEN